jgi:tetratricopeptide (TPR) repeat protein
MRRLVVLIVIACAPRSVAAPPYLAVPLDRAGRLDEALPLYRARAAATLTTADRLRHAGALLRAGRDDEARAIYDGLIAEKGSVEHGDGEARTAMVCASSLLLQGFPALAVGYLRPPQASRAASRPLALLLARATLAAGDPGGARAVLARPAAGGAAGWAPGERLELARARMLLGEPRAARALLDDVPDDDARAMFRDSVLADAAFVDRDWTRTAALLHEAARRVPASLSESRVDTAWRNAQRELRGIQIRHAVALWKLGRTDDAAAEAVRAAETDEEAVRAAALLMQSAADLADERRDAALARLEALGGHDHRFTTSVAAFLSALASGTSLDDAATAVIATLQSLDRSREPVTTAMHEVLLDGAVRASATPAARAGAPAPFPAPARETSVARAP